MNLSVLCSIFLYISTANCAEQHFENFYWRDYNGVVPEDAFPAGKDINGEETYIGQVYHHGFGFLVAQLFPRQPLTYYVSKYDNVYTATSGIKIFCTDEGDKFKWVPVSDATYGNVIENYQGFVSVGKEFPSLRYNQVGRLLYNGATKVGSVWVFNSAFPRLCFVEKNQEKCSRYYELLVFDNRTAFSEDIV